MGAFFYSSEIIYFCNFKILNYMGRAFEYRKASKLARWDKMAKTLQPCY